MTHVAQYKKDKVKEFTKLIDDNPIIGIVNMMNLPAKQLQNMRERLREKVIIRMTKKRLIKIAIKNSKKENIAKLKDYLKGMPAMLFTKENPFSLFSTLKKNKSKAPISAGQTAPNDIIVPAGKTNFAPGPVIGELGGFGIITAVEDGKIAIKEDKVVAKEGDVVDNKLAGLLQRLGVKPMEVGLNLVAVFEKGEILTKEVLDIDEDAYRKDFREAAKMAFNLAFNSGYPTEETIILLIQKASSESKSLALEANLLTDETVGNLLSKAESQAESLNSKLDIKVDEEKKEEIKTEEKPKEKTTTEPTKTEETTTE
ncbi:50S ribosomal protein L10, partial [Candidatus Woesearchaeota archaeon]|nr:50S ribosomal protein L10 [Candidatus Woesearchaeota archaeon]